MMENFFHINESCGLTEETISDWITVEKKKKSSLSSRSWQSLPARPWCSPVEHEWFHRTATSVKITLWPRWITTKTRVLCKSYLNIGKTPTSPKSQTKKSPPLSAYVSNCCFFINYSFGPVLIVLPPTKVYLDTHSQNDCCFLDHATQCQVPLLYTLSKVTDLQFNLCCGCACTTVLQTLWVCTQVLMCMLSRVQLFVTLWTVARQAPLSTGFSRQKYCSRFPFPPPGDLPNPAIKPVSCIGRQILYCWATWEAHLY